ncbi:HNH endonuclease [Rhodococcus erythropolis]|uniref:HNH endonuclease n=1 Tax=Rhodococcus erythropolis TaxID=1833 RepID=UPI00379BDDEF
MSDEIRYTGDSDKDGILRMALLNAWAGRCYQCGKLLDFSDAQIDHVIPTSHSESEREALLADLRDRSDPDVYDFDLNAPANLAPICRKCNLEKSNSFRWSPRFETVFHKVRAKAEKVEAGVRSLKGERAVAKAIAAFLSADLGDPRAVLALTAFAPVIDARIRLLDYTMDVEHFDPFADESDQVSLKISEQGRRTIIVLEEISGVGFDNALLQPIRATKAKINKRLKDAIEAQITNEGHAASDAGTPTSRIDMEADVLRYDKDAEVFELAGTFEAKGTAVVSVASSDGSEIDTIQRDASTSGRFSIQFSVGPHLPPEKSVVRIEFR